MAKRPLKERAISAAVVIPAAIVIVALAFLQYNWSNQVSEATSLRLADSLQMSMINWHLDLFRDFSQVCIALGVDPAGEAPPDLQQFARAFSDWKTGAPYPELVSGFYIVPEDTDPYAPILRFDAATRRFRADVSPAGLEPLREQMKTARIRYPGRSPGPIASAGKATSPQNQQFVESFYPGGMLAGWSFDPSVPALVHPLFRVADSPAAEESRPAQWI